MASSSTDSSADAPNARPDGSGPTGRVVLPAPLSRQQLALVPGVLGKICLERAADYERWERGVAEVGRVGILPAFDNALRLESTNDDRGALRLAVIAEVKRASPSQGAIAELDPVASARAYASGGAAAISVLTEPRHFGGELADLVAVTADQRGSERPLPVLRKDFTVHPQQLLEAAEAGASAVLLIVAVVAERLADYLALADALGLQALVEVHTEGELDIAIAAGSRIIGANNRDLKTLATDLAVAPRLLRLARNRGHGGVLVAESGYSARAQLDDIAGLADAVLVGTSLAGSGDLERALRELTAA